MKPQLSMFALLLLAVLSGCSHVTTPSADDTTVVTGGAVVWHGIYRARPISRTPNPLSPSGFISQSDEAEVVATTDRVPATLDTHFGITYRVDGTPRGATVEVTEITVLPPGGIPAAGSGKVVETFSKVKGVKIGETTMTGYWLRAPNELKLGRWRIQVWYHRRLLAEQVFLVESPVSASFPG